MTCAIEFSSATFLPTLPEDCQPDPGVYGFELALWLAQALCGRGIVTGYPSPGDLGLVHRLCADRGAAPDDCLRQPVRV